MPGVGVDDGVGRQEPAELGGERCEQPGPARCVTAELVPEEDTAVHLAGAEVRLEAVRRHVVPDDHLVQPLPVAGDLQS